MARGRPGVASIALTAFAVIAVGLNVFAQVVSAGQGGDGDSVGGHALDLAVGTTFAACGLIARRLGARRVSWLMVLGATTWTFGTFTGGLIVLTPWWVPLAALQSTLAIVIAVLALGYPTGRIGSLFGRLVVAAITLMWAADVAAHLFFYDPHTLCGTCVANPIAMVSDNFVSASITYLPVYWGLVNEVLLVTAVAIRWLRGSQPWRAVNLAMTVAIVVLFVTHVLPDLSTIHVFEGFGWWPLYISGAATASVPVIFVVGLHNLTQTRARVADVILAARTGIDRAEWDRLTREALDDTSARIFWASDDGYVDADGDPARIPASATPVISGTATVAVIVHDPATGAKRELLDSLAESLRLMTDNDRLTAELAQSLRQVRESRQRLVGAADDARRRIERDLHDGAQQLLLTAALSVEQASRRARSGADRELAAALQTATDQLVLARRELRELARGITPAVLSHGGLDAALEELALRCPVPTSVTVGGEGRPSELAETTIYFIVSEALTNIAAHAGAASVSVVVDLGEPTRVTITDDGMGGAAIAPNGGLAGLVDRVEAIGGEFTVSSPVGRGTVIRATVPTREREPS